MIYLLPPRRDQPEPSAGPEAFHRSFGRTLLIIFGGLVLCAGAALMLVGGVSGFPNPLAIAYAVIGLAGLLLFPPGILRLCWQLAQRRPIVEIGPAGVLDRRMSGQPIGWHCVSGLRVTGVSRQRFLTLDLVPGTERQALSNRWAWWQFRLNRRFKYHGVHVGTAGLACTAEDLVDAASRHWAAARRGS